MGGVAASERSILDGTYPYSRKLYLITDGVPAGLARRFVTHVLGNDCQQTVVRYAGFTPVL